MKDFKIAIVGYKGKMGSTVYELLKKYYDVVGINKGEAICDDANLVIDFASAESSVASFKTTFSVPPIPGTKLSVNNAIFKRVFSLVYTIIVI